MKLLVCVPLPLNFLITPKFPAAFYPWVNLHTWPTQLKGHWHMYFSSVLTSIMFKVQEPEIVHPEARKPGVKQREVFW